MKMKQILLVVAISAVSALSSVFVYSKLSKNKNIFLQSTDNGNLPVNYAGFYGTNNDNTSTDFTNAANAAVPAVVHIKTKTAAKQVSNNLPKSRQRSIIDDFFGDMFDMGPQMQFQPEQSASGSGVIISEDGYIITNNHVIADGAEGVAEEITVTLSNKKTYQAKFIGKDPSTDLAVLKIDDTNLPFLVYGNSDNVKLGQWVLAIGYPLSLETTVTAGIVSAKGRSIGINQSQSNTPIESFIQTDAAINRGNSGGALITTNGQLIGINSAFLAPNGTYAGYGFAIPANLTKKVISDLIEFGEVKRSYLGISAGDQPESVNGAVVGNVAPDGSAAKLGLKKGDVITHINETPINSWPELQGVVSSYKTGEKVNITYKRDGKEMKGATTLSQNQGSYAEIYKQDAKEILDATMENITKKMAEEYDVDGGVLVKAFGKNSPLPKTRMEEGFVITSINDSQIKNTEDLGRILTQAKGTVRIAGFYPGLDGFYAFPLKLK